MVYQKTERIENRELLNTFHKMRCLVCSRYGCDPCHIKSKGSGGDDTHDNLLNLCRIHHSEQHAKGHKYMSEKYPSYRLALESRGWQISELGKLTKK